MVWTWTTGPPEGAVARTPGSRRRWVHYSAGERKFQRFKVYGWFE